MKIKSEKVIFLLAYLAYASIYIARLNLTVASPILQEKGLMSAADIGVMGGIFFLFYSVGQLINGYAGDVLPPKLMVLTGLLMTGFANVGIWKMENAEIMVCLWGLNGFAQSMLWGPLLRTVGAYFRPEKRAVSASILVSSVGVGSVIGVFLATIAVSFGNVKNAFLWPGLIAMAAFGMIALFFPYSISKRSSADEEERPFKSIFHMRFVLLLLAAMFHGVLKDNINLWMASYFMDSYAIDLVTMSFYVFLIPLLSLAGRMIYPFCFEFFGRKVHRVSIATLSAAILSLIPLSFGGIHPAADAVCLSVAAAAISMVNTSFLTVYPMRYEKDGCVSKVVGVMDFATYMGAGISSFFYGGWLEKHSYSEMFFSWIVLAAAAVAILSAVEKKEKKV